MKLFKNGSSPKKEEVYISIEESEAHPNILFLVVRNNITRVTVFKGFIFQKISKIENFMGKKENLRFELFKNAPQL